MSDVAQRQVLVVCTANLCRSPVGEAMLRRKLDGLVGADGDTWTAHSAGTGEYWGTPEPDTMAAAGALGHDISQHTPRQVTAELVASSDLIVTMTREHLRTLVANHPEAWTRTFTLRELVRRATDTMPSTDSLSAWLTDVGEGRRAADLLGRSSSSDDVDDPYRKGKSANQRMVADLDELTTSLIRLGPWRV